MNPSTVNVTELTSTIVKAIEERPFLLKPEPAPGRTGGFAVTLSDGAVHSPADLGLEHCDRPYDFPEAAIEVGNEDAAALAPWIEASLTTLLARENPPTALGFTGNMSIRKLTIIGLQPKDDNA